MATPGFLQLAVYALLHLLPIKGLLPCIPYLEHLGLIPESADDHKADRQANCLVLGAQNVVLMRCDKAARNGQSWMTGEVEGRGVGDDTGC